MATTTNNDREIVSFNRSFSRIIVMIGLTQAHYSIDNERFFSVSDTHEVHPQRHSLCVLRREMEIVASLYM